MKAATLCAACVLSACSAIKPQYYSIETEHVSHASQHAPFTNNPTHYGETHSQLCAHWTITLHSYFDMCEGYRIDGWAPGPNETTVLRGGMTFGER